MTTKPCLALALLLAATVAHATALPPDTCGAKDPQQVEREAIYCGDDAACIARETAGLPEAQRSLECEARRLSPVNVLGVSTPAPAPGQM